MRQFNSVVGKVAIITDTHFGARSDSMVFHSYFMRFYDEVFFPWLVKNDIKVILHLGDFTDRRKYINFFTLNKVRKYFVERLQELGITLVCTVGNHDTFFKNTNEVNSMQELFSGMDHIVILTETEEVMIDDTKVLLVPWINENNYERSIEAIKNSDAKFCMGHLELKGFLMQRGQRAEAGLGVDIFKKFQRVCSGHYHHKSSEENVYYLGSPYEMTFADVNDPRGFHGWVPATDEMDFLQNPFKMFHRLYYDDKEKTLGALQKKITEKFTGTQIKVIVQNRTNPYYFEQFMDRLFSMNPAEVKIEEDLSLHDGEDEMVVDTAEDTLTILNKYVDTLEIDSDKAKIKEELRTLYIEATNMEQ
jgi:DNA repair exonuclease SbcCD nuclease subunit